RNQNVHSAQPLRVERNVGASRGLFRPGTNRSVAQIASPSRHAARPCGFTGCAFADPLARGNDNGANLENEGSHLEQRVWARVVKTPANLPFNDILENRLPFPT